MEKSFKKKELKKLWDFFSKVEGYEAQQLLQLTDDTDEETVFKMLSLFCASLKKTSMDVEQAVENKDVKTIWSSTHKIASSADLLGFKAFGRLSRDLSHELKDSEEINHRANISAFLHQTKKLHSEMLLFLRESGF